MLNYQVISPQLSIVQSKRQFTTILDKLTHQKYSKKRPPSSQNVVFFQTLPIIFFIKNGVTRDENARFFLKEIQLKSFVLCSFFDPTELVHHPLRKKEKLSFVDRERTKQNEFVNPSRSEHRALHAIHTEPQFFHSFTGNDKLGASNVNYEDLTKPLLVV